MVSTGISSDCKAFLALVCFDYRDIIVATISLCSRWYFWRFNV